MITLSSDFGTPYPAAMKGVILRRTVVSLVDVAHDFPRQDVRTTAFWLREVLPYFPPATRLVVVDPGVGTDRAALAIEAGDHRVVAPDKGWPLPAVRELADEGFTVYEIPYGDAETSSNTFHGRDVFAPAAAAVHEVGSVSGVEGPVETGEWVDLRFPEPSVDGDAVTGEILAVDGFGNAISNIPGEALAGRDSVVVTGWRRQFATRTPASRTASDSSRSGATAASSSPSIRGGMTRRSESEWVRRSNRDPGRTNLPWSPRPIWRPEVVRWWQGPPPR